MQTGLGVARALDGRQVGGGGEVSNFSIQGEQVTARELPQMKLFLASYRNPNVRLFRRNVVAKTVQDIHTGRIHQINSGIAGQCDVYGYRRGGQVFEIEFKAQRGKLSDEQERWKDFCEGWGIPWLLLRAEADKSDLTIVRKWTHELDNFLIGTHPP